MSRAREFADLASSADAGGITGKNLVTNGAMLINQRGSVTAASGTALTYGGPDRWRIYKQDSTAVLNISQSTDVPSGQGFKYSYKVDVTTADSSVGADDRCDVIFRWEGQDLQHLKKGTSQAVTTTLQFWVKSSKTGTHICEMFDNDNTRQISKTYTVNTADTWEHKTITFEGDTTGALAADNGNSMQISWWLLAGANTGGGTLSTTWTPNTQTNRAVGQVNVLDSTSNEWYITGVQLEVGEKATDFEHRSFADELARCQRYYYVLVDGSANSEENIGNGRGWASSQVEVTVHWPEMRATPSLKQNIVSNYYFFDRDGSGDVYMNSFQTFQFTPRSGLLYNSGVSGVTAGYGYRAKLNNANAYLHLDAEL